MTPDWVMIFAAGRGTRMGALTDDLPKPLIEVAGKPLLDRVLDLTEAAGITKRVVNTHYLGHKIADHLRHRDGVTLSDEASVSAAPLETGGGLKQALGHLGEGPVFTLNADAVWTGENPLKQLARAWDPRHMSALLLLVPPERATGHAGAGDFKPAPDGRLSRFQPSGTGGLVYTGAQIIKTGMLRNIEEKRFSINRLWDEMIAERQLFGTLHSGGWADVGTAKGIALAEALLRRETGDV